MKYKPRTSNFEELQDEFAERLLSAGTSVEAIKDMVAEEIDTWVEAILKGHVEDAFVSADLSGGDCPIEIRFSAGTKILPDGTEDLIAQRIGLGSLLDDFCWWDELEEYEPEAIRNLEARVRAFADRLRDTTTKIESDIEHRELNDEGEV